MKTKNEIKIEKFPYYTGDWGLGLDPSEGSWDGNKFTSDGVDWYLHDEEAVTSDGNGVVWLYPLANRCA
jgi:hypothetical protein